MAGMSAALRHCSAVVHRIKQLLDLEGMNVVLDSVSGLNIFHLVRDKTGIAQVDAEEDADTHECHLVLRLGTQPKRWLPWIQAPFVDVPEDVDTSEVDVSILQEYLDEDNILNAVDIVAHIKDSTEQLSVYQQISAALASAGLHNELVKHQASRYLVRFQDKPTEKYANMMLTPHHIRGNVECLFTLFRTLAERKNWTSNFIINDTVCDKIVSHFQQHLLYRPSSYQCEGGHAC